MHLKIAAPGGVWYEWEIVKITIPTEGGEITILPWHQPLTSVVKAGIISFVPEWELGEWDFVVVEGRVQVAVSKGLLLVDGEQVVITTSAATTSPEHSAEVLQQMQSDMTAELEKITDEGNAEDIVKALENMAKVEADLRLVKLKNIG